MVFSARVRDGLRDPRDGGKLVELTDCSAAFEHHEYPCVDGRPVLLDGGLFAIDDVVTKKVTTQDSAACDKTNLKNRIRQRLPGLTRDPLGYERVRRLARRIAGRPVLVIGAGHRVAKYRSLFPDSEVVASDVHLHFGADVVLDAHRIPFRDRMFGAVLASQVLEHVSRPWIVASEMQRVTELGGFVHVEVPFVYPYHGIPYDFFRLTPSALRFLFPESNIVELDVTEGRFSAAASVLATGIVDSFHGTRVRQLAYAASRLGLWWMPRLDAVGSQANRYDSPANLYVTAQVDGVQRDDRTMLDEVSSLIS
jgi:hypothetical protein